MAINSDHLLSDMVQLLVNAYGRDAVRHAVENTVNEMRDDRTQSGRVGMSRSSLALEQRKRTPKATALEIAKKINVPNSRRDQVEEIAKRFDQRAFLPTSADAREFLILAGKKPKAIKDRSDAFKQVLTVLLQVPTERLAGIVGSSAFSGPSDLSDISDAIGQINKSRQEQLNFTDKGALSPKYDSASATASKHAQSRPPRRA